MKENEAFSDTTLRDISKKTSRLPFDNGIIITFCQQIININATLQFSGHHDYNNAG